MPERDLLTRLGEMFRSRKKTTEKIIPGLRVDILDWNDPQLAQQHHVTPGLYMAVQPITERQHANPQLIKGLFPSLFQKLEQEGRLASSDVQIPVDQEGKLFVDPAQTWMFSIIAYDSQAMSVLLRADQMDANSAKGAIKDALDR